MLAKYVGMKKCSVSVLWEIQEFLYLRGCNMVSRRYWKHHWHKLRRKADQNLIDEGMEEHLENLEIIETIREIQKLVNEIKGYDCAWVNGESFSVINGQVSSELYWGPDVGSEVLEPYDWGPKGEPPYTPLKWVEGIGWVDP